MVEFVVMAVLFYWCSKCSDMLFSCSCRSGPRWAYLWLWAPRAPEKRRPCHAWLHGSGHHQEPWPQSWQQDQLWWVFVGKLIRAQNRTWYRLFRTSRSANRSYFVSKGPHSPEWADVCLHFQYVRARQSWQLCKTHTEGMWKWGR